ncbi:MAG: CotH kinase family protein, partial [Candidatus Symbiothrix sp.]|nr:CotH kinase family protein [Candidatus Symbiothrix sp.]
MQKTISILFTTLLLTCSLQAQDLAGYQKQRGAVIATTPDNDYTRHACNAFDTNKGTSFMAQEIDGWVGLDLGASYSIRKIRVYPMPDRHNQFEGAKFQGANNPEFNNAVTLFTVNQGIRPNEYSVYDISNAQAFRYVRCINSDHRVSLAELEFYTDENVQPVNYNQLTNLPTIYLETGGQFDFVNKSTWVAGKVAMANAGATTVFDAQIRGRGNSSWDFMEKKSFRIKFDKKQNFLGLPAKAKNWTLIAIAVDKTLLRNGLAFEISKQLGFEFTPSCQLVDVVLDGFYYGTFMASDHIDVNENRINIDEMAPEDITTPNITGGYHLEIDAYANLEPSFFHSPRGIPFTIKSPDSDEILPLQKEWIENHIAVTENTLFDNTEQALQTYIDLQTAVKYYIHSELTGNCDSYWCIPCYKKRSDDKLYFGPVWDYDQAFLTNYRVPLYTETLSTQHGVAQSWFRKIMQQPAAQTVLHQLWKQLKDKDLQQQLIDYLDNNSALLQQSQALNYARWNSLNRKVWFEDALFDTYNEYINFVKEFINERFTWFDNLAMERRVLLAPSTPDYELHSWRYTFDTPPNDWYTTAFNDSKWPEGDAPFGTERNLQNTLWNTGQIYIRTQFFVNSEDLKNLHTAFFYVFHDEDCQIYLNGELALERNGYITDYQYFEFDKNLLQAGWNTLAVKCTQTIGGQLIDVGIFVTPEEI